MIQIFHVLNNINTVLGNWRTQKIILDFRVFLRMNENLYVYLLVEEEVENIQNTINKIYSKCEIETLFQEDLSDSFYKKIFDTKETINIETGRRRFDSILDIKNVDNYAKKKEELPCAVATFYSYKGGMGRSTTLATFAMHLAMHENKNIVILDCDFEAPGFTNFYLKNAGEENQKQGIVEYILDKHTSIEKVELEKYTWEVDKKYCGNGSIRIMPAGNLDTSTPTEDFLKTHLNHYIEGLSRIDFVFQDYIIQKFEEIINDLHESFKTDVILIDSRTGFGDIMGITAFHLSQFVIGFFRNDAQTIPGLHFFLENVVKRYDVQPFIVNSILPQSLTLRRTLFNQFKEDVFNRINGFSPDKELDFPCFPISRNENLEILGTTVENTDDLIELIQNKEIREYKELFEKLAEPICKLIDKNHFSGEKNSFLEAKSPEDEKNIEESDLLHILSPILLSEAPTLDLIRNQTTEIKVDWTKEIKMKLLQATEEKLSKTSLYAENINIEEEFQNKQFFFRNCMNDLFNLDKVLILGSKGTGKSYIYSALKSKTIVAELKKRANKEDNYSFIYMVDKTERIFKVNKFDTPTKKFQYSFWLIYTWLILTKEVFAIFEDYQTSVPNIPLFNIQDDFTTQSNLEKLIDNENIILAIEKDMHHLDSFLIEKGNGKKEYITVVYDQLDEIVEPSLWNEWLPSLIDFWRVKRYSRIFGKLFVRKDLFRKLMGITNIKELENQAIDVEWKLEEVYAYFFKLVLSQGNGDWFWAQMYLYEDYPAKIVAQLRPKYNNLEQIPLEEYYLKPLVTTFFGKEVDMNNSVRMGESYEWFIKNLKSADGTISIRPFIDLIKLAISKELLDKNDSKPILFPLSYNNKEIRKQAVERHFEDLYRNEAGNMPLSYIFEYIDNHREYQYLSLNKSKFFQMLENVLKESKEGMEKQTKDSLEQMLIVNGIVKKENRGRGDFYKFAYLYKYRLGLSGN